MKQRPRILLTNDDGIRAPGLKHLWSGLKDYADLYVVAPLIEQSAVGLGITIRAPLHIEEAEWFGHTPAWSVTGTPADCVKMALSVLLPSPPDLIISGINRGSNAGRNLLYSGTVGGVIEGVLRGIPGIAVSSVDMQKPNYEIAEKHLMKFAQYMLETPLPQGTLLNVNFPSTLPGVKGIRFARQGKGYWMEAPDKRCHPFGAAYYWLGAKHADFEEEVDSDMALLAQGYAAAVPVHVGELTDHAHLHASRDNFDKFFYSEEN